jgi:hypothetical protein
MDEVRQAADSGDAAAAGSAFAGDTHNVTHDIDQPLRAADPLLAHDLCESILSIEEQFGRTPDLQALAAEAGVAAELLQESGRILGLSD